MYSTMHIDLCALNQYGCLLVVLESSVLLNPIIFNKFQPVDRVFNADVQYFFLLHTSCYLTIVIEQYYI